MQRLLKSGDAEKVYLVNKGAINIRHNIEKEDVYYNEKLEKTFDSNYRRIATLISRKPITEDYISLYRNINEIDANKCYTSDGNELLKT
ncbi:hypothetical protein KQX54_019368 [Cotesia glomerata]|uniref:Uncharacterized protein n=1 Tax=Cotesia glomerata TaxID=32391 RepID=A0AAV7I2D1_COTGL|nr:hypothetical protein KQX54_019368 [Cotesia glomerata]